MIIVLCSPEYSLVIYLQHSEQVQPDVDPKSVFQALFLSDLPSEVNPECASTSQFFTTHHMFFQGL